MGKGEDVINEKINEMEEEYEEYVDSLSELQTATDRAYLGDIYLNEIHSKKYSIFPLITM